MTDGRPIDDWIAASLEALERHEASGEPVDPIDGPEPGELYVQPATRDFPVEWAVVAREPTLDQEPSPRALVLPADAHVLAGSADVEVTSDTTGPLVLRGRFGLWSDPSVLTPDLRVGRLDDRSLTRIRQRWLDLGDGREPEDPVALEVDESTEYQDWIEDVLAPAHRALLDAQPTESAPPSAPPFAAPAASSAPLPATKPDAERSQPSFRSSGPSYFKVAASILVALAGIYLWRLQDRVQDLEVKYRGAEEHFGAKIESLEGERDRLEGERNRLEARRQELEAEGAASREEAEELRERVEDLDRRLGEESKVVNPAIAFFRPPDDNLRGDAAVRVESDQTHVMLFLPLLDGKSEIQYKLQIGRLGSKDPFWMIDGLQLKPPGELRLGLPITILPPDKYWLSLSVSDSTDNMQRIAIYDLEIR